MQNILLLAVLLLSSYGAWANVAASGWCEVGAQAVVTSGLQSSGTFQASYPQCLVTVYPTGSGTPVPSNQIFSNNGSTVLGNPFTANTNGWWQLYAANGRYDIVLSGAGFPTPLTIPDVSLFDPATGTTAIASALAPGTYNYGSGAVIVNANNANHSLNLPSDLATQSAATPAPGAFTSVTAGAVNAICMADMQVGADAGLKIAACVASLPSTGGTVDARSILGNQNWTPFTISKPGIRILMPNTGRMTSTSLPFITVTGTGVEIHGSSMGSNNATIFSYAGTTAGDFILFQKDANYGKVENLMCESTGNLAGTTSCIHSTDTVGQEARWIFASDGYTSSHVGQLRTITLDVATLGQVPPRGQAHFSDIFRTNSLDSSISSFNNSSGISLNGIAGTNGSLFAVRVDGQCNIETVGIGIALGYVANSTIDPACWMQGNGRELVLNYAADNIISGLHARCNGGAHCVEHGYLDNNSSSNVISVDFGDAGFGTIGTQPNIIINQYEFIGATYTAGTWNFVEGSAPTGASSVDVCGGVSSGHALKCSYNNDTPLPLTRTVAVGATAMNTGAIGSVGACSVLITVAATGVLTTDTITTAFNSAPASGYGQITLFAYPTANQVNFYVCNPSSTGATLGAATLNWRVVR